MLPTLLAAMALAATPVSEGGNEMSAGGTTSDEKRGCETSAIALQESKAQKDARMKWFREARFGMFIHWGLYAVPAGVWQGKNVPGASEWLLYSAKIKIADYEPLLTQFNPVNFDADEWARIAKEAGMKYVVITSKHHDGFALYPSAVSTWDVEGTPFKRDILGELSRACKKVGIRFCTYHSIMDWHHPDYLPRRPWDPEHVVKYGPPSPYGSQSSSLAAQGGGGGSPPPSPLLISPSSKRGGGEPNFDRYVAYMKAQLAEIVKRYDPDVMWFDGEWEDTWNHDRGVDLYHYVRSLKPSILINNRVDKGRTGMAGMTVGDHMGDFGTPEQEIPSSGLPGVDWESCMTMNHSWGYHQNDHDWKSAETLIRNLVDCASKGGNYLLNVGPNALGEIPVPSVERLAAMGNWLKVNGEAVYGTQAGPFPKPLPWGRVTSKPGKLYLHVFQPAATLDLAGLQADIRGAYLLADPKRTALQVTKTADGYAVALPDLGKSPATVVVLEVRGQPTATVPPLRQAPDGSVALLAEDAEVVGTGARYEGGEKRAIGYWTNLNDVVTWEVEIAQPGRFSVEVELACEPGQEGSTFEVAAGSQKLTGKVPATKGWADFTRLPLGEIAISRKGKAKVTVRGLNLAKGALMNFRAVRWKPASVRPKAQR
jgi:alpha-L-fucosidase